MKDKVVVVTGAASGIGAALGNKFGQEGSKIALLDVDEIAVKARGQKLVTLGIDAWAQKCDVIREDECHAAMKEVIRRYGGIDVLINNAGITQRSLFADTRLCVFRKVMDVNFFGSLHCTKAAIESLIERKGMIIVTSSIAGLTPVLGRTGYCASKHALHGLFNTLRVELKNYGVHVMIVCPGFTRTRLQARALGGNGKTARHPRSTYGKEVSPQDVAEAIYHGAVKRKRILVMTPVGKLSYILNRFAPALYDQMMARKLEEEFKE